MRVYKCDGCGEIISNPFEEKMKEFNVDCEVDCCGVFPVNIKRKVKVDLCEDCFKGLYLIANEKVIKK